MIIIENIEINGQLFTHTYSDANKIIQKIGTDETYSEAFDVLNFKYEETERNVEVTTLNVNET